MVAERIWRAWEEPRGRSLADVEAELEASTCATGFPFTLVALEGREFAGTVSGIAHDLDTRPRLTPWVASLWVEPHARKQGLGRQLVSEARARLLELHDEIYLYAIGDLRTYYVSQGWSLVEEDHGPMRVDIFRMRR